MSKRISASIAGSATLNAPAQRLLASLRALVRPRKRPKGGCTIELFASSRLSGRIPVKRSQAKTKYRPDVDNSYLCIFIANLNMEYFSLHRRFLMGLWSHSRVADTSVNTQKPLIFWVINFQWIIKITISKFGDLSRLLTWTLLQLL